MTGLRARAPYYAYRGAAVAARGMPGPLAGMAARGLGLAFTQAMRGRHNLVARHQQRVRPDLTGAALQRAVQRAFDSYARYWMEAFRLPGLSREQIDAGLTAEGYEHLVEAHAAGKGAILVVPHLGNWDFGGAWLAIQGIPVTAVAEPVEPPELFEWFAAFRRKLGLKIIPLGPDAGVAVLRAVKAGEVVGLVCDRDIAGGGIEVEFFGERTKLPGGPATLALRTGAPVLPVAIYFDGPHHHRGVVRPPIPIERTGRLRDDVARVTQTIATELEGLIRQAPEQWHLFMPNWPGDPGYRG